VPGARRPFSILHSHFELLHSLFGVAMLMPGVPRGRSREGAEGDGGAMLKVHGGAMLDVHGGAMLDVHGGAMLNVQF
jgi:hypothetical protein